MKTAAWETHLRAVKINWDSKAVGHKTKSMSWNTPKCSWELELQSLCEVCRYKWHLSHYLKSFSPLSIQKYWLEQLYDCKCVWMNREQSGVVFLIKAEVSLPALCCLLSVWHFSKYHCGIFSYFSFVPSEASMSIYKFPGEKVNVSSGILFQPFCFSVPLKWTIFLILLTTPRQFHKFHSSTFNH